jgi:gliding motility-associated-like protein
MDVLIETQWTGMGVGNDGTLILTGTTSSIQGGDVHIPLVRIDPDGSSAGYLIPPDEYNWTIVNSLGRGGVYIKDGIAVIQARGQSANSPNETRPLISVNFDTGSIWARKLMEFGYNGDMPFTINKEDELLSYYKLSGTLSDGTAGFTMMNPNDGSLMWHNDYQIHKDNTLIPYLPIDMAFTPSDDFVIVSTRGVLTKITRNGAPAQEIQLEQFSSSIRPAFVDVSTTGDIYVSTSVLAASINDPRVRGSAPIIIKLDEFFNIVWAKLIVVQNFPLFSFQKGVLESGDLVAVFSTQGELPIVSMGITSDGALSWYRGYAQPDPHVQSLGDGSLYFRTRALVNSWGLQYGQVRVTKSNPDGSIDDCTEYMACVDLIDFPVSRSELECTVEPAPPPPLLNVNLMSVNILSEEVCDSPIPPNAYFEFPERTCAGYCLWPDSLYNYLAQLVEWRILGPSTDTLIADSSFVWCFDTPGTYTIEQEIWSLGCSEFYARQLEVLPDDLTPPLMSDTILCQSPPYTLQPQSSRPLSSFLWSDGSMGPVLSVNQGGVITLEAGDGACSVRDTIELQFVEELIPQGPYTQPEDVGLCEQLLPYLYRPYSTYTSEFSLPGAEALPDGSFLLSEYGRYELSTELYGCPFSTTWELQELPCELPVYLPNAFSPNFDGINDYLEPQGIDFEPIRLQVFDRWGGLLFQTSQAPFRWDGQRGNQAVQSGVYVVRFEYRNLRTGGVEEVVGDVVVVR